MTRTHGISIFNGMNSILILNYILRITCRASASLIVSMTYNFPTLKSERDPSIARIHAHIVRLVNAIYPGHLVEHFNWLERLPSWLTPWKTEAAYWGQKDTEMFTELYKETLERVRTPFYDFPT